MTIDFKQDILAPVATDFTAMDTFINEGITSKVALVMAVSKHVVEAGGKRMRPIMCLLAAKACGATDIQMEPYRKLAAIIEMLHTATLVHDDVVDESGLRRGRPTANATWNNQTAVLVGDFLISRAFDLLVDLDNMVLLKDFSTGTCEIAEGEVLQLQAQHLHAVAPRQWRLPVSGRRDAALHGVRAAPQHLPQTPPGRASSRLLPLRRARAKALTTTRHAACRPGRPSGLFVQILLQQAEKAVVERLFRDGLDTENERSGS